MTMLGLPGRFRGSGVSLERIRILLVENNAFMRSVITGALRALGVEHLTAVADGVEAVHFLGSKAQSTPGVGAPVDIVLTDLVMPSVDGLMLLRWIRASAKSPDKFLPVVMLSGAADRPFVEQARDLG